MIGHTSKRRSGPCQNGLEGGVQRACLSSCAKATGTLVAQMCKGKLHCAPSQLGCTTSLPGSAEMTTPDAFAACAALRAGQAQRARMETWQACMQACICSV